MGRIRRSTRTNYSYFRRAPYNLRSRSKKPNYLADLSNSNSIDKRSKGDGETTPLPQVTKLNLNEKKNAQDHHTDEYDESIQPVFRRGRTFVFEVTFNCALNDEETAAIIFATGRNPLPSQGTLLSFSLLEPSKKFKWSCEPSTNDRQMFTLTLTPSPEAILGEYSITSHVICDHRTETKTQKGTFNLIFNPWCELDEVYLADETERSEYVLNETGRIWVGNKNSYYGKPWSFGQFHKVALETALHVLEISDLSDGALSNPITVARVLSKMTNSFDDNGILEGNWSGDYSGGVEPTDWINSVDILNEYMETKCSVKYGQCWVFSGLITTLLRAVGIPSRCVTNFESAHDNDISMTIDRHWDENDQPLTDLNDSIWNFHVWNECWCKRHDLPDGYDGWQALDATPQERSEGVMQCGPASLNAIRQGDVYLPYDAKFIFAEVNGDIIEWVKKKDGEMKPVWKEPHSVGVRISTKSVGSFLRHDVTDLYKYSEGSAEEREVVNRVSKYSSRKEDLIGFYDTADNKDVSFNLYGTGHTTGDIDIVLEMTSSKPHEVSITLTCVASYYNGLTSDELNVTKKLVELSTGKKSEVTVSLLGKDYLNKIATDANISVFCKAVVEKTGQYFFKKETFSIDRPDLLIDVPSIVNQGSHFNMNISFTNQLSISLTECRLLIDVPGATGSKAVKLPSSSIGPGATINQTISVTARTTGVKEIIAQLHTRQLQNITGSATVIIQERA